MRRYRLLEAYGVELEYMIVDRETLSVRPIVDELFHDVTGEYVTDVERGSIAWSNELVNHVVELKTNGPSASLAGLAKGFQQSVREINDLLAPRGAVLLPTGSHPLMDPLKETTLWPHEWREIYGLYDRIFDCRGHGWSNVQSAHLNLPFDGDTEFEKLHAAVRVLLPIMPAVAASTPILDGRPTGFADSRLEKYRLNQKRIPSLTGVVIPEPVFSEAEYRTRIFDPIMADIRPFDTDGILDRHFVNSRGAIARFDRGSIEIRVLDTQECPMVDLAIVSLIVALVRALIDERWSSREDQKRWSEGDLAAILLESIRLAEEAVINDRRYLEMFGMSASAASGRDVWIHLWEELSGQLDDEENEALRFVLDNGTLSTRISRSVGREPTVERIEAIYRELARCLQESRVFVDA